MACGRDSGSTQTRAAAAPPNRVSPRACARAPTVLPPQQLTNAIRVLPDSDEMRRKQRAKKRSKRGAPGQGRGETLFVEDCGEQFLQAPWGTAGAPGQGRGETRERNGAKRSRIRCSALASLVSPRACARAATVPPLCLRTPPLFMGSPLQLRVSPRARARAPTVLPPQQLTNAIRVLPDPDEMRRKQRAKKRSKRGAPGQGRGETRERNGAKRSRI